MLFSQWPGHKGLQPPPPGISGLSNFFPYIKKSYFFLSGTLVQPPPPLSGPATKKRTFFCGFPNSHQSFKKIFEDHKRMGKKFIFLISFSWEGLAVDWNISENVFKGMLIFFSKFHNRVSGYLISRSYVQWHSMQDELLFKCVCFRWFFCSEVAKIYKKSIETQSIELVVQPTQSAIKPI